MPTKSSIASLSWQLAPNNARLEMKSPILYWQNAIRWSLLLMCHTQNCPQNTHQNLQILKTDNMGVETAEMGVEPAEMAGEAL